MVDSLRLGKRFLSEHLMTSVSGRLTSFLLSGPGTLSVLTTGCSGSSGKMSSEENRRKRALAIVERRRGVMREAENAVMVTVTGDGGLDLSGPDSLYSNSYAF
jgi:hypothetical protein